MIVTTLPIGAVLEELRQQLATAGAAVLQAPPGAGKTTVVPLVLLPEPWLAGRKMLMLEPRRLAARAAATRLADTLGEEVGDTVGYRTRLDTRCGPRTRLEVVTEGIMTRMLQQDPALADVGLVIFDEFHERSLEADLGLALTLDARQVFRPDLRLLVMSATLDAVRVAGLLGNAPVVTAAGRLFPVTTEYLPQDPTRPVPETVAAAVRRGLATETGDLLVFLPGTGEIRRVMALLMKADLGPEVRLVPLYGDLPRGQQDAAIRPAPPGFRKVVLATAIAETSLTIEGIRLVIDAGLMRVARFDPGTGMSRLETIPVSLAAAEQRRGRAGRLGPGVCWRLWTEERQRRLVPETAPEILAADLAPLALELANWGVRDPAALKWLDPPPAAPFTQARDLLTRLGALDAGGAITSHGRAVLDLGMHPRLAHTVLNAGTPAREALACELAALLTERDIFRTSPTTARPSDLRLRVEALHRGEDQATALVAEVDPEAVHQVKLAARHWRQRRHLRAAPADADHAGLLLAFAYPDRIGQRRPGEGGRFRLANGRGASFTAPDALARSEFLVAAHLDGAGADARIYLAAPITLAELVAHFADAIQTVEVVAWDAAQQAVVARRRQLLGELVLKDDPLPAPDETLVTRALLQGLRELGLGVLPWNRDLDEWRARVNWLRRLAGDDWPDLSDPALLATLEDWLAPWLAGKSRRAHLRDLPLKNILLAQLSPRQVRLLDELAPTHLTVPSGSHVRLDYSGEVPVLAVRLQELFGCRETPRVGGGKVPVLLHLLSPAQRPVQVTQDLASFWATTYAHVRKELRGRYPRHHWPEDPLSAPPTNRAKPRRPLG